MTQEIELLEDRLKKVDVRLSELEAELKTVPVGSAPHAELLAEQHDLTTIRRTTDIKVRTLQAPPDAKQLARQRRRDALVKRREIEIREDFLRMAEKWSREGDHRQARHARMNALDAREAAEREFQ